MPFVIMSLVLSSLLLSAAIFGFFYAWVCSTMWGLDSTDPRIAITAMKAMNASVVNPVFAPAFFATPIVLAVTAVVLWWQGQSTSATFFMLSCGVYFFFAFVLTVTVNVPMNEALATTPVPDDMETARRIWQDYSAPWQFWNQMRTIASGLSFLLAAIGALRFVPQQGGVWVPS